jgi:hypothetical protein
MFIFSLQYKQKCVYLHYQSKRKVYNGKDKNKTLKSKRYERVFERPDG